MNLRQLEAFRATVRCGSITAAARMMNVSQPSVSRLVADLERSVGFALFARVGRGLTPTVEGQSCYQSVEGMFSGISQLQEIVASIRASNGANSLIGTILSIATNELPGAPERLQATLQDARSLKEC